MVMLAIPNVSEGRDQGFITRSQACITSNDALLLDTHSDPIHNRTVLSVSGTPESLGRSMIELALVATEIDLELQRGVHPRLGGLDVCPFVPWGDSSMGEAVELARSVGRSIAETLDIPVFLYGEAATSSNHRELPEIRRGGLAGLIERASRGRHPDLGPASIDPARGVICVGARSTLIAFNVWLECDARVAKTIAGEMRRVPGVRALGLPIGDGVTQVSMNLIDPSATSIDDAFEAVARRARASDVVIAGTEIVGVVPQRYLPDPEREAARKLIAPGRSLESVLS